GGYGRIGALISTDDPAVLTHFENAAGTPPETTSRLAGLAPPARSPPPPRQPFPRGGETRRRRGPPPPGRPTAPPTPAGPARARPGRGAAHAARVSVARPSLSGVLLPERPRSAPGWQRQLPSGKDRVAGPRGRRPLRADPRGPGRDRGRLQHGRRHRRPVPAT